MRSRFAIFALLFALAAGLSCAPQHARPVATRAAAPAVVPGPPHDPIEAALSARTTALSRDEIRATAHAIVRAGERHGIEPALILAVIHIESGYFNFARSPVGALGLMQVMPATGRMLAEEAGLEWSGPADLLDPVLNVTLGTRYLAFLRDRYGDWDHALAAYNWGPGAIDRRLARGASLPVRYRRSVLARLDATSSRGGSGAPASLRTSASIASSTAVR